MIFEDYGLETRDDKNYLNRKCERLDREIDRLACLTAGKFTSFTV